ncbi:MAG: tRNA pseudouridine(38-40) synthase TruA [Bacteroidia bacterium]|nr:MAG: tRNA pseudouridine(38-40) synthase TruA [Bacteroidia bacterium]
MTRYFIHMAYDGTAYCGWQIQPNEKTVQELVELALTTILRQEISVTGAGRTDTGVHASYFIAHFDVDDPSALPPVLDPEGEQFVFKLNRFLPPDIVIYKIYSVPSDVHARFSAIYRTYHYHISTLKPLFTRGYCHHVYGQLDLKAIQECCVLLPGISDFTSFAKLHTDVKTNNCHVMRADWTEVDNGYLFEIKADRFLRNMVRSLTGTLLDVGQGKLTVQEFKDIVEAKDRSKAGQSVPARGLFLVDIGYDKLPEKN